MKHTEDQDDVYFVVAPDQEEIQDLPKAELGVSVGHRL